MSRHRWLVPAVAAFVLTLASSAVATEQVVSATAALTGSGTSYRMVVRNTGNEPILCFGLLLDGVQPVAASGPPGVLTRVGTFQGRGLVHMQGNTTTPAVPAGGTANVDFQTNVAIAQNAGGEIRYSSTCAPGSDQVGRASGPTPPPSPPPPPPPTKPPCRCLDLDVTRMQADRMDWGLRIYVRWSMRCTRTPRGRCEGKIEADGPRKKFTITMHPKDGALKCKGNCQKKRTKSYSILDLQFKQRIDADFWEGQSFTLRFKTFCKRGSGFVLNGTQSATIAYDEDGEYDRVQSDLNANGKPDGDE